MKDEKHRTEGAWKGHAFLILEDCSDCTSFRREPRLIERNCGQLEGMHWSPCYRLASRACTFEGAWRKPLDFRVFWKFYVRGEWIPVQRHFFERRELTARPLGTLREFPTIEMTS
jgi:hypothetical protein